MKKDAPKQLTEENKPAQQPTSTSPTDLPNGTVLKKVVGVEGFVCLAVVLAIFVGFGVVMGLGNALNTMFNTAFHLLINTCLYLMAVAVIIGALSEILTEFGVISLANKALCPLMKPLFGMPGATSMAILASFLSDNPAVLTLADNKGFRRYFKKYQLGALTNMGTTFGMGLIVIVTMMSLPSPDGTSFVVPTLLGVLAVIITCILVTRVMLLKTKKVYGKDAPALEEDDGAIVYDSNKFREVRGGSGFSRFFGALLDGGASGVKIGLDIIPGVLIIATLVMMLTYPQPAGGYTGAYGEGVALIPAIGEFCAPVFKFLFGFTSSDSISVPLTALGSAGAALGLVKNMTLTQSNVAVFTAMCMFWSGYLSTHVSMLDSLKMRELTAWALLFHTLGGIVAGIVANLLVVLIL